MRISLESFACLGISTIVFIILPFVWKHWRFFYLSLKLPCLNGHIPLIGAVWKVIGADGKDIHRLIVSELAGNVSPRGSWLGPFFGAIVDDPEQVQKVFNSKHCGEKPLFFQRMGPAKSLAFAAGNIWKSHRKLLNPSFSPNQVKTFLPTFNVNARMLVENLKEHLNDEEFNILGSLVVVFCNDMFQHLFGISRNFFEKENRNILESFYKQFQVYWLKGVKIWLHFEPIFRLSKYYDLEKKYVDNDYVKIFESILEEKEDIHGNEKPQEEYCDEVELSAEFKSQILIDQLYKKRDALGIDEVTDEVHSFMLGGFEPSTICMANTLLLLAMHPDVQEKTFAEINRVMLSDEVTNDYIKDLVYLDLVLKESLRMIPLFSISPRRLTEDMELGSYVIPKGANFIIPILKIHNDPAIWGEDVREFKPERFTQDNFENIHQYAYIPFAGGPRKCVAETYSKTGVKVTLCHVLKHYKFTTSMKLHELTFETTTLTKVVQGWNVKIERRNPN